MSLFKGDDLNNLKNTYSKKLIFRGTCYFGCVETSPGDGFFGLDDCRGFSKKKVGHVVNRWFIDWNFRQKNGRTHGLFRIPINMIFLAKVHRSIPSWVLSQSHNWNFESLFLLSSRRHWRQCRAICQLYKEVSREIKLYLHYSMHYWLVNRDSHNY